MKVSVKNGVYLDQVGNYFTVEIGESDGRPAIKVTGLDKNDNEVSKVILVNDEQSMIHACMFIYHSEYLGEL